MIAEALFSRIEVLGAREATIHLTETADAHGFVAAIRDRLDVNVGCGRGERDRPTTNDLPITMRLAEPPEPSEWLQSA
jgi:hypothetical protein